MEICVKKNVNIKNFSNRVHNNKADKLHNNHLGTLPMPNTNGIVNNESDYNTKFVFILTISFILAIFIIQFIQADVKSFNPGGSLNLAVTTDKYIEGFFFGIPEEVEEAPVCGNSIIESGEQCDDGNTDSGDGCSSTCQTEAAPPGNGGVAITPVNIAVFPTEFNINLAINTNTERIIRVTNLGTSTVIVGVSQQDLAGMIILGNFSLTIAPGETVDLDVVFVALSETGIFTGKIFIGGKEVLVAINVKTKLLLFDSNIVVLNENFEVPQGAELRTLVTLIPLGDPERLDVTLNFVIKDYRNKVYLTKSETILVEEQTRLNRNFDTGILPLGDYVVGLELVYPNGVAPSSAHFKVTPPISIFGRIVLFLAFLILILAILILIVLIWRRRKKKEEQGGVPAQ